MPAPPGAPAVQGTPLRTAGDGNKNPNYIRCGRHVVRRRDAVRWIKQGRARRLSDDAIQLLADPTDLGYDRVRNGFEFKPGVSGHATVIKFLRGPEAT